MYSATYSSEEAKGNAFNPDPRHIKEPRFIPLPTKDRVPLNFVFAHEVDQLPRPTNDITFWWTKKIIFFLVWNVLKLHFHCNVQIPMLVGKKIKKKNVYVVNISSSAQHNDLYLNLCFIWSFPHMHISLQYSALYK